MKLELQNTKHIVTLPDGTRARVWCGMTQAGVPVNAYIALVQVRDGADTLELERELREVSTPTFPVIDIPARLLL